MKSEEARYNFAAKAITDMVKRFEINGVSAETAAEALLSAGVRSLLLCSTPDKAASLLDGMADAIRRGEITRDSV
jgi:hypothetical protein